jgi:hypothetical protein
MVLNIHTNDSVVHKSFNDTSYNDILKDFIPAVKEIAMLVWDEALKK